MNLDWNSVILALIGGGLIGLASVFVAIIGMTDLVLESELDAEQKHFLGHVRSAAQKLLSMAS